MLYPKEEDRKPNTSSRGQSLHPYSAKYTMGTMPRAGAARELLYKVQVECVSW